MELVEIEEKLERSQILLNLLQGTEIVKFNKKVKDSVKLQVETEVRKLITSMLEDTLMTKEEVFSKSEVEVLKGVADKVLSSVGKPITSVPAVKKIEPQSVHLTVPTRVVSPILSQDELMKLRQQMGIQNERPVVKPSVHPAFSSTLEGLSEDEKACLAEQGM
jgi:hypothetical protein